MINFNNRPNVFIFLSVFSLILACCDRYSKVMKQMDIVESVMNLMPDSAMTLLNEISSENISTNKERARYALLKSMALDKNYVDTTTFDVLQPAINYYLKKGCPDEKLRTLYYQGRIYQNKGENDSAMYSFLKGRDFFEQANDTMTVANLRVAMATIQYKMYKFDDYIKNNVEAAKLYKKIGLTDYEISCLGNAMDGCIIKNNKSHADSILSIVKERIEENPELGEMARSYLLNYLLNFGEKDDILRILSFYNSQDSIDDFDKINIATAYYKLGNIKKATQEIGYISSGSAVRSSLKYLVLNTYLLEQNGDLDKALEAYKEFSTTIDSIHLDMMSHDLLFAQKKYEIEKSNIIKIHKRDRNIWIVLCLSFLLFIGMTLIYYRYRLSQAENQQSEMKRISLQQMNEKLELERQNTILEKKAAESELYRKSLEAENLRKENENLELEKKNTILEKEAVESERDRKSLETENLKMKIDQLEKESQQLKEILEEHKDLEKPLQEILRKRMEMLNALLATTISNNDKHAKLYNQWRDKLIEDKDEFMKSTRLTFTALYPNFIGYMTQHDLSESEINYVCLYAIGLRGTEVGDYIKLKRHYHISSEVRKKLGIDEHETNLGIYIRKLLKSLQ